MLSTQVARKFVETFFGRLDARTASYEATAELLARFFPASYELLRPGVTSEARVERAEDAPVRIAFSDREERAALRLFLRALRHLPEDLPWEAIVYSKTGAIPTLRSSLRNRVTVVDDENAALAGADVVVTASLGQLTAPGVVVRALGAGAVPLASRLPVYEEILRHGEVGLHFEPGDVDVLTEQLERLVRDDDAAHPPRRAREADAGRARLVARRRRGRGDLRAAGRAAPRSRTRGPRCARGSPSAS